MAGTLLEPENGSSAERKKNVLDSTLGICTANACRGDAVRVANHLAGAERLELTPYGFGDRNTNF